MRRWEDIAKDKLEGYESRLPEGSLAEFRALRDGAGAVRPRPRFAAAWALAGVAAVLAAVLLFWRPAVPDEGIRIVQQPPVAAPAAPDSSAVAEAPAAQPSLVAQAAAPQAPRRPAARPAVTPAPAVQPAQPAPGETEEPSGSCDAGDSEQDQTALNQAEAVVVPFVPEDIATFLQNSQTSRKTVKMSVGKAAGIVGGTTLLAAAAMLVNPSKPQKEYAPVGYGYMDPGKGILHPVTGRGTIVSTTFLFPLKAGLSARIPVSDRLAVTTGLEYSLYKTHYRYLTGADAMQAAHYIGIPMRLDWTLASSRWLDLYLGGGFSVDACVRATLDGQPVRRDGFAFSLLGAGGIQFNLTRRLGLYVEPELSWTAPSNRRVLDTYRTATPLSFTIATGLRFTIGK
ncbi:hypothetical protein SAMN06298214_0045 [Bacteroidales bacterium WCE2004]|nr:hypothetical protein SAMN06298214_0045 [Bacteroidales bacterium WCE2004]